MTHFLSRLVDRTLRTAPRVEPLIRSPFASPGANERVSEVEAPRLPGDDNEPPPGAQPEGPTRVAGENAVPPAGASDGDGARREKTVLLVPQHLLRRRDSDGLQNGTPSTAVDDIPAVRTTAVASRKPERAIAAEGAARRGQHSDASAIISKGDEHERAPVVRVTIGRIDVRATPAPASSPRKTATAAKPALELDAYLKARKEGAR